MKRLSLLNRWTRVSMLFLICGIAATLLTSCSKSDGGLATAPPEMLRALTLEFDPDAPPGVGRTVLVAEYKKACAAGYGPACKYKTWDRTTPKAHERLEAAYNLFGNKCTDDASDPGACLVMAWYLSQDPPGKISSTSENPEKATKIFRKLCNAKVGAGCTGLGKLLNQGVGTVKSEAEAAKYYYKGCRFEYAPGCDEGAWLKFQLLEDDDSDGRDETLATKAKACDLDPLFCIRTGYILGSIDKLSKEQQVSFFRKHCKVGSMRACYLLGLCHRDGDGTSKNMERAVELFRQTCDDRFDRGCVELGFALSEGAGVEKDDKKAVELFRQGCVGDIALGCHNLAAAYHEGDGIEKNELLATQFYEAGCKLERASSCITVGFRYYEGEGVAKDEDKALAFMSKACEYGEQKGCDLGGYPLADRKKFFALFEDNKDIPVALVKCVLGKMESKISLKDFRSNLAAGSMPDGMSGWVDECIKER